MKTKLKNPESQIQEVLFYLITRRYIDRKQMIITCNVFNLPEQIRRLRTDYNLEIKLHTKILLNKFKRKSTFNKYSLVNKKKATTTYIQMQNKQLTLFRLCKPANH